MVEKKEKAPAAKKAPAVKKAPAEKKAAAPKAAPSAKKEAAPAKVKAAPSGKTVTLVQIGSPIGRQEYQRATLIGLGLNKLQRRRTLQDTPAVRGMIEKVKHLVKIVEA